jgi:hypothetical protein
MRGRAALRDAGLETSHGEGSGSPERFVAATEKAVHHQAEQFLARRGSNLKSAFSYIFLRFSPSLFLVFYVTAVDPRNLSRTLDPVFLTCLDFCQTPLEFRHMALHVKIYITFQYVRSFYISVI